MIRQLKAVQKYLEPAPQQEERPEHPSKALRFGTMGEVRHAALKGPDNHFCEEEIDCWDIKLHGLFRAGFWVESTLELDDDDVGVRQFYVRWLWKSKAGGIHVGTSIPFSTLRKAEVALAVIAASRA